LPHTFNGPYRRYVRPAIGAALVDFMNVLSHGAADRADAEPSA
jgi:hypothetical protein